MAGIAILQPAMHRALRSAVSAVTCGHMCAQTTAQRGQVLDATTGKPVMDALITMGHVVVKSDDDGRFTVGSGDVVRIRAPGYRAAQYTATRIEAGSVSLQPFTPHALYLSAYGISSQTIRSSALSLIHNGSANALVVDIKSDRGLIPYPSAIPLVKTDGARKLTLIQSLPGLVTAAHAQGMYMIARIVTFEDPAGHGSTGPCGPSADGRPFAITKGLPGPTRISRKFDIQRCHRCRGRRGRLRRSPVRLCAVSRSRRNPEI